MAELKALALAQKVCNAQVVTYRERESNTLFLPDLLQEGVKDDRIFVVSWGFDVPKLVKQLAGHSVVYHAHSANYGFRLPASVPIVTVSRNTLGYWGAQSPHSLIYYLPNEISDEFCNPHPDRFLDREIDVLVQSRKSSQYLMQSLVPALQTQCRVKVLSGFVESLSQEFRRSKVYLYDSSEYWAQQRVTEGFGLPPMEALASGCHVFSSVNHALSDYLDPGFNSHKIAGYSTDYDSQRILACLQKPPQPLPEDFFSPYRSQNITDRWAVILTELNQFFDYAQRSPSDIPAQTPWHLQTLRWRSKFDKFKKKLQR